MSFTNKGYAFAYPFVVFNILILDVVIIVILFSVKKYLLFYRQNYRKLLI